MSSRNKTIVTYVGMLAVAVFTLLLGTSVGSVTIPFVEVAKVIINNVLKVVLRVDVFDSVEAMHENIIWNIRLPRVILAGFVGASLAIVGAAFQGLLRNPLADPFTLGVSSGASVGAVVTIFFNLSLPLIGSFTLPFLSIVASFLTIFVVLYFARKIDRAMRVETIILTGVIFSSFLGAFISLMIALTGDELRQIIGWLLGSVSMRGWSHVSLIAPFFIIGAVVLLFHVKELNAMSFGEEHAQHLGVNIQRKKLTIMIAGSILTGAAVAVSGTIGFVGLVVPHFIRLIWGPDHTHLLPLSMLAGGSFLVLADLISRTIIAPAELPIGVITALIGAPIFAVILTKNRLKSS